MSASIATSDLRTEELHERVEDLVGLLAHEVVAAVAQRLHCRVWDRLGETFPGADGHHRIARGEQEEGGAFHPSGALEPGLVVVARGEVGVQHAWSLALRQAQGSGPHPGSW